MPGLFGAIPQRTNVIATFLPTQLSQTTRKKLGKQFSTSRATISAKRM
jgi:hypothetical protein